jgi:hypothetical protein
MTTSHSFSMPNLLTNCAMKRLLSIYGWIKKMRTKERTRARKNIDRLKESGRWPETTQSPFSKQLIVHAVIETDDGVVVLFGKGPKSYTYICLVENESSETKISKRLKKYGPDRLFLNRNFLIKLKEVSESLADR